MPTDNRADGNEENFLGRWSRRKAAVRAEAGSAEADVPADDAAAQPIANAEASEKKVLTDADMPAIESLTEDSDYSGFLSPGVSEGLRKMALRKLFGGAGFNVRDGLDDYDDDFRNFAALGDLITSDMRHQMEREAEREAAADGGDEKSEDGEETAREADEAGPEEGEEVEKDGGLLTPP